MAKLHKKVKSVLERSFEDLLDCLEEREGRVSGYIASSAFDRLDDAERQKRLWQVLEQGLTPDELLHVGPIATLGHQESAFPIDDDRDTTRSRRRDNGAHRRRP